MSGGHFDYKQYCIGDIAGSIEKIIEDNDEQSLDEYGYTQYKRYSDEVVAQMKVAVHYLNTAFVFAQRIDWLVSGDDGEECFHRRLAEELAKVE